MTAANTEPALVDWSFTAGDATTLTFVMWDDDDESVPSDLTGRTYRAEVRTARNQAATVDAAATCTTSVGGDSDNEVTLSLSAVQTRALRDEGRRFFYDLEETVDSLPVTIARGSVLVNDDVTR